MEPKLKKLHPHLVESLAQQLQLVFVEGYYADKVLEKAFKQNKKWGSRDRKFFAENFYSIVRNWRRLLVASRYTWSDQSPCPQNIDFLKITLNWLSLNPTYDLSKVSDFIDPRFEKAWESQTLLADRESVPDWMDKLGKEQFADSWPEVMASLNQTAPVFLRVNTMKTQAQDLKRALDSEGVQADLVESALKLKERKNVFTTESFKEGLFEVQDIGSQKIAPYLNPLPGERILDACAGAGGKTLHLADLMKNKGKIIASDIHEWKLKELKKRAARGGYDLIEAKVLTPKQIKRGKESFDGLLLDVPCSGMGVLRRNPDSKWKLTPERIKDLMSLQKELLVSYQTMVKPGGRMVYATCSVLSQENEEQIKWFLENHSSWRLKKQQSILPGEGDGFYMALLERV